MFDKCADIEEFPYGKIYGLKDKGLLDKIKSEILTDKSGPIVRFIYKGQCVNIVNGFLHKKHTNVIHHTTYWGIFSTETIQFIESELGVRAQIES